MSAGAARRRRRAKPESAAEGWPADTGYRRLRNPFEPLRVISDDQVEAIHRTALGILEDTGVRVLHVGARELFAKAGAEVDPAAFMVRLDASLVEAALAAAPRRLLVRGASAERDVEIGGRNVAFTTVGGPPNASGRGAGKRPGSLADYQDFVRLAQSFDVVHLLNQCLEPLDVDLPFRLSK